MMRQILSKRLTVRGFIYYDFPPSTTPTFCARLVRGSPRVAFATVRTSSTVSTTRQAPSSECLEGRNFGKLIVRVAA